MREFFTIAIFKIKADIRMNNPPLNCQKEKQSMLSLRRATPAALYIIPHRAISIHALLAESDRLAIFRNFGARYFYPRSPCGERLQQQFAGKSM